MGDNMKIVHVEDYFDPTAGYQINELLNVSKNFNNEVFLITSDCMKPFHKSIDHEKDKEYELITGVKIIRLKASIIISSRVKLKNLYKTIDNIDPDIVFFHGIGDFKDLLLWKKKKKYMIIRDCHMSWVASQNKFRKIYYKLFKIFFSSKINGTDKYHKIYALGKEEYSYLQTLGISEDKIDYLYHGYNNEIIYFNEVERKEIRDNYLIKDDEVVISYIGKFDNAKCPDLVFDIVENLQQKYIDDKKLILLFIGPKNEEYMIKFLEKKEKLKVNINIIIDGAKSFNELRKYFSASDICIFPKECTLSSIHAQVCGANVIMENHESNKERVINNRTLYDIGNINQASLVLKYVIENKVGKNRGLGEENLYNREYKYQMNKLLNDINGKNK